MSVKYPSTKEEWMEYHPERPHLFESTKAGVTYEVGDLVWLDTWSASQLSDYAKKGIIYWKYRHTIPALENAVPIKAKTKHKCRKIEK